MKRFLISFFLVVAALPARADDSGGGKDVTIEEFLQQLSTVQGVMGRRDPFGEMGPPFDLTPAEQQQAEDPYAPDLGAPPMERYPVSDYEVVAVLLGDKYPRALMRLPADTAGGNRKVVIIKERDKLGNRKGVVSKIVLEGVIVEQALRSEHGFVDKTEVLLKVGGHLEEQRRSMKAKITGKGK